ncbi:MAG: DegT/DnrJ/EryC1/StrS family aminotransferase [Euryarchaeota archaeon]|nr:DegT/DnrJ/EryC1/StrS family aminotransferase [Euryarchaeota archaeon]
MTPTRDTPALLGGRPVFPRVLPITKPTLPPLASYTRGLAPLWESGLITNSTLVKKFEEESRAYLGANHAVALASCTSGLILSLKRLGLRGDVVVPSFTFSATAHALAWNGLRPVFADCDPHTWVLDAQHAREAITRDTTAILGVHTFGNPCDVLGLEALARERNLKVVYDSAHGMGARVGKRRIGTFGDAEVFSFSPTKLLVAAEGGIVATPHESLAKDLRKGRNYGDPGTYDCEWAGLNARMSELHALLALQSLKMLEKNVERRNRLAALYRKELGKLPGLTFQKILLGNRSTCKDFSVVIDPQKFGLTRDQVAKALDAEHIMTRKYFFPPLHRMTAYRHHAPPEGSLPETDHLSRNILSLPLYSHMTEAQARGVAAGLRKLHHHAPQVAAKLQ